ncbi:hypothetical protein ABZ532_28135 [Streptomyces sp. NPDC019396]|uniref:hypothetical protein n=1 Tax=Streptomyces sp. NPDC019396 TaxID=3154687 RepID=UPI0033EB5BD7
MDLGRMAWGLLGLTVWGVVLFAGGVVLLVLMGLGGLQLLLGAVRRSRGVEPATEQASLADFRWEEAPDGP